MPHPFRSFIVNRVGYRLRQQTTVFPNRPTKPKLLTMSSGLVRYQETGDLHFITFSCFRHRPILGTPEARNTFLEILEQARAKYDCHIFGYVVMPDHVHLLITEPEIGRLSTVIQVIKQRFSRTRPESEVWESRYYDFNVKTEVKRAEKLHYIHQNPVRRGLVPQARRLALEQPKPPGPIEPWPSPSNPPKLLALGAPSSTWSHRGTVGYRLRSKRPSLADSHLGTNPHNYFAKFPSKHPQKHQQIRVSSPKTP